MAAFAANAAREADLNRRLLKAAERLAIIASVELPPPFPYVRDEQYRRNDATEWSCILVERVADALEAQKGETDG